MGLDLRESDDVTVHLMTSRGNAIGCWYGKEDALRGSKVVGFGKDGVKLILAAKGF